MLQGVNGKGAVGLPARCTLAAVRNSWRLPCATLGNPVRSTLPHAQPRRAQHAGAAGHPKNDEGQPAGHAVMGCPWRLTSYDFKWAIPSVTISPGAAPGLEVSRVRYSELPGCELTQPHLGVRCEEEAGGRARWTSAADGSARQRAQWFASCSVAMFEAHRNPTRWEAVGFPPEARATLPRLWRLPSARPRRHLPAGSPRLAPPLHICRRSPAARPHPWLALFYPLPGVVVPCHQRPRLLPHQAGVAAGSLPGVLRAAQQAGMAPHRLRFQRLSCPGRRVPHWLPAPLCERAADARAGPLGCSQNTRRGPHGARLPSSQSLFIPAPCSPPLLPVRLPAAWVWAAGTRPPPPPRPPQGAPPRHPAPAASSG